MKRLILLALTVVLIPSLLWAQDDNGERHGRGRGNGNAREERAPVVHERSEGMSGGVVHERSVNPVVHTARVAKPADRHNTRTVSPQFRNLGVRTYPKPVVREKLLVEGREHSVINYPSRGPSGAALNARVIARTNFSTNPTVRSHMSLVTRSSFTTRINVYNRSETRPGSYYWHTDHGFNYCHYYDPWGYHWYGWYLGNAYFWTRWYSNNWWWYDPVYYRWCYWHDGGWWWQDPDTTTIYVYNNGSYVMPSGEVNVNVNVSAPVHSVKRAYTSNDGARQVKLVGDDAFLYDISGQNAFKPVYLASNVTDVKFSNTDNGKPLRVMLTLSDGSFEMFDDQGNSLTGY